MSVLRACICIILLDTLFVVEAQRSFDSHPPQLFCFFFWSGGRILHFITWSVAAVP